MKQVQYIHCLTPLRGIAALLVIVFHYQLLVAKILPHDLTYVFNKLYLMVDLFFVLSGFIMYHVFGEYFHNQFSTSHFFRFMKSRFARIYPLHLITMMYLFGVSLVITITNTPIHFWSSILDNSAIISNLLLTQAMGTHDFATWNSASWSISVEWWAYVCFPVFMLFLTKTSSWSRWLLGGVIIAAYFSITYSLKPDYWAQDWALLFSPNTTPEMLVGIDVINGPQAFLRCLCGFAFGLLIYEAYRKLWAKNLLRSGYAFVGSWSLLFVLWHFNLLHDPVAILIFGIMILSAAYNDDKVGHFFNGRCLQYIGNISYSLYLVHLPILYTYIMYRKMQYQPDTQAMNLGYNFSLLEAWIGLFFFLTITFMVSALSYKYIEKPARLYLK